MSMRLVGKQADKSLVKEKFSQKGYNSPSSKEEKPSTATPGLAFVTSA